MLSTLKQDTQSDLKLGERKDGEGMPKIYSFSDTSEWRDFQVNEASSISVFVSEFDAIKYLQKSVFVEQGIGCCEISGVVAVAKSSWDNHGKDCL